jgi:hypothetical protein
MADRIGWLDMAETCPELYMFDVSSQLLSLRPEWGHMHVEITFATEATSEQTFLA